jgi:hypothetical protein
MLPTYPAYLRDGRVEWAAETPPSLSSDHPIRVHVTLLEPVSSNGTDRGKRMAAALERLATGTGLSVIADPLAWQREQREDRELPGRES